ncbi:MAG: type VI secretion system protein TssA [Xanthomonadaceae bacterium]|nr:type VI secretion system protein TssA [Xanthomonadaceae bacterium]
MSVPASDMQRGDIMPRQEHAHRAFDDDGYFGRYLGVALEQLLAPIDGMHPAGLPVYGTMAYRMVEQARRGDDATLPMGAWAVDLKRPNWPKVSSSIIKVLGGTAKDLQLASWLLEAEIQQRGFAALAPCMTLLRGLCDVWWDALHPQPDNGDFDARINIVRWMNEKLLAPLSLIPLIGDGEQVASWSQWELAHYHERLRAMHGELPEEARGAATIKDLRELLCAAPLTDLRERHAELAMARTALADLEESLRGHLGSDAPSLGKLDDLLARVQGPLRGEMARRGVPLLREAEAAVDADDGHAIAMECDEEQPDPSDEALPDREAAYRTLADIAEFLAHIEPHSPVPYLIRRAVSWGRLDAAALYRELFVKSNGQIGVIDLLGLDGHSEEEGSRE